MAWTHAVFMPAYAKINLTLEVLGRRPDGFHDLASVLQAISLHDTLALAPAPDGARTLVCDVPVLAGEANLALRAAHLLAAHVVAAAGSDRGVRIELRKETPVQAGLGGGSADAAAALLALARLWGVAMSAETLRELAAQLGSDVPFFLAGGTALVEGRGERVTPLPDAEPLWLVLLKPPVAVPTGAAFAALGPGDWGDGAATAEVAGAVRRGAPLPLDRLVNTFEASVRRDYPLVARAWDDLLAAGAPVVRLSGSGPTLFAPFRELSPAAAAQQRLRAAGHETWLAHSVGRAEVERALPLADTRALGGTSLRLPSLSQRGGAGGEDPRPLPEP
jgi:4-diphosphocytidyl-2-C-methyl-D-erythritol kinase